MFNTSIPDHFINMLISHHFTFLWGLLPLLPSKWVNSVPCDTMYSTIVQYNACTFYSLLVWWYALSKPKLKLILTSIIRSEAISSTLKCLVVCLNWTWERHYKAQNIITICKYLQIWLEAHSLVVKNLLKLNEMCTVLFV